MRTPTQLLVAPLFAMLFPAACFGTELTGTVKTTDGKPIAEVTVYSFDDRGIIAPREGRRFSEKTDSQGRFKLRNHGQAIYFRYQAFQPLTKIIEYATSRIDVVLEPEYDSWNVPSCTDSVDYRKNKDKYVEMRNFLGPSLFVPRADGVQSKKVRDIDYVLYVFTYGPSKRREALQGWFGLYAADLSVSARSLVRSTNFKERRAKFGDREALDIYGQTTDGKYWHYVSFWSNAIFYEDASKDAANKFDDMLSRMCYETRKP